MMILSFAGLPMGSVFGLVGAILLTQTDPPQHAIAMGSGMLGGCITMVVLAASLLLVSLGIWRMKRWALRGLAIWAASVLVVFAAVGAAVVWSNVTDQPFTAALAPPLVILGIGVVAAVVLLTVALRLQRSASTVALLTACLLLVACSSRGPTVPSEAGLDQTVDALAAPDAAIDLLPPPPDLPGLDAPLGPNTTCVNAAPLVFSAGKAMVKGSTAASADEYGGAVTCGLSGALKGPQRYYKAALRAGSTYKISLDPRYRFAHVYVASGCGAAAINASCGSKGAAGAVAATAFRHFDPVGWWTAPSFEMQSLNGGWLTFRPSTTGVYTIVVDGLVEHYGGAFTLTVEKVTRPANDRCAKAKAIALSPSGSVTVKGSLAGAEQGPQVYYAIALATNKTYRVSFTGWSGLAAYILDTCSGAATANPDIGWSKLYALDARGHLLIQPKKSTTNIAVGRVVLPPPLAGAAPPLQAGAFELTITELKRPAHDRCQSAMPLTLVNGRVSIVGTVAGAENEFGAIKCGNPYITPQVYYRATLSAGKRYRVSLTPRSAKPWDYWLYAFHSGCSAAAIEADCASSSTKVPSSSYKASLVIMPTKTTDYTFAVEHQELSYASESFTLQIEEAAAPHAACSTAQSLTLVDGAAVAIDDTTGLSDAFGSKISCGLSQGPLLGPQLLYQFKALKDKVYTVILDYANLGMLYLFSDATGCDPAVIDKACSPGGSGYFSSNGWFHFSPAATATYQVAVDSPTVGQPFRLSVTEYDSHATTCAAAPSIKLQPGNNVIRGFLYGPKPSGGETYTCGSHVFAGRRVHYRLWLEAGTTYTFLLEAGFPEQGLILSRDSCVASEISTDCSSGGKAGGALPKPQEGALHFTPQTTGWYRLAVNGHFGLKYRIEIFKRSQQTP